MTFSDIYYSQHYDYMKKLVFIFISYYIIIKLKYNHIPLYNNKIWARYVHMKKKSKFKT